MSHALLAPSSAYQWRWCAGSVNLSQGIGDEDTDASRDGTAAHWVAEQVLHSFKNAVDTIILPSQLIGQAAPNGVVITDEIADGAKTYTDEVLRFCQETGLVRELMIEQSVKATVIHPHCWGTPDCYVYDAGKKTLHVWDLKFGHGRVGAYENWQLICYAVGVLSTLNPTPFQDDGTKVVMTIVQPRCYDGMGPVDEWSINAVDLRGYINQLKSAAEMALNPVSTCHTGNHCRYCKASHHCTALLNATANVIDITDSAIPTISTDAALGYELEQLKRAEVLLKARREAKELEVEQRLREGKQIAGWSLQQAYGKRDWIAPQEEVVMMGQLMGVNLLDEPKLLTPAKADAACKKLKIDTSVISSYYKSLPTGMKLVFDDGGKAKQIFSNRSI